MSWTTLVEGLTMQNVSAVGSPAAFVTSDARPRVPYNVGWERLTADDWDLLSAMAGEKVGPDAPGMKPGDTPPVPLAAADMLIARSNGAIAPGHDFPPEFFQAQLMGQSADMREQLERALAYATQRDAAKAREGIAAAAGRVDLYA